jgi:hypothetical protein
MTDYTGSDVRGWCITINNWTAVDLQNLLAIKSHYLCYAPEIGEKGTPHLQAYLYNKNKISFATMQKKLTKRAHLEPAGGHACHSRAYIFGPWDETDPTKPSKHKDVNPEAVEIGEMPAMGKRNDIKDVVSAVKGGATFREILETATSYQSLRVAEVALKYLEKPRDFTTEVYWFYGPSGTGKSHTARIQAGDDAYYHMSGTKWYEGYDGQSHVVFEEVRHDTFSIREFLLLADKYPYRVECKGGSRQFRAKRVWITSPYSPKDVFGDSEQFLQIARRVTKLILFDTVYVNDVLQDCKALCAKGGKARGQSPEEALRDEIWKGFKDATNRERCIDA